MNDVIKFLKDHKDIYKEYFVHDRLNKCNYGYTCDINQIYCHLNLVDICETEYFNFFKISLKKFNLNNKKILEIGCGYIPILSSIYKNNGFDIDAINQKIVLPNYNGVTTFEADLSKSYNIQPYDIVIGFRPCNITENMLDMCNKYHKDFLIYMCPCVHKPKDNINKCLNYDEWLNYLLKKTSCFENFKIQVIYDSKMPDNCPILVGKYLN